MTSFSFLAASMTFCHSACQSAPLAAGAWAAGCAASVFATGASALGASALGASVLAGGDAGVAAGPHADTMRLTAIDAKRAFNPRCFMLDSPSFPTCELYARSRLTTVCHDGFALIQPNASVLHE